MQKLIGGMMLVMAALMLAISCKSGPKEFNRDQKLRIELIKTKRANLNMRLASIQQAYNQWKEESDKEAKAADDEAKALLEEVGLDPKKWTIDQATGLPISIPEPAKPAPAPAPAKK